MVNPQPVYIHHVQDTLCLCRLSVRRIEQSRTQIEHSDQRISDSLTRLMETDARENTTGGPGLRPRFSGQTNL
jgi:hypothetical protein